MSHSVQFFGRDSVVEAFEYRNCPAWSLWQGRQFLLSKAAANVNEAAAALDEFLQMIEGSETTAVYTLKVYEETPGRITDKTPCDGSFNFKLNRSEQTTYGRTNFALEQRLAGIEKMLTEREETEEPKGIIGQVLGYIENNEWAQQLLAGLIPHIMGNKQLAPPAQQLAGTDAATEMQLQQAIAVLKQKDPKLAEHLTKLAALPDPQLQFLLQALDNM